jgi:hypothetical protein
LGILCPLDHPRHYKVQSCTITTLALGSWPRQGLQRCGQEWNPRVTFHAPGSVGKCEGMNPTLPSEFSLWELESQWIPRFSKGDCRGQISLDWKIPYIIGKLLELKCLKWARTTHLNISNISYGQKKGWESNWLFDSRPLKVGNLPDFLVCRWCATYFQKDFDKGYNFALDLTSIKGLHTKLWARKVVRVPILGISGFQFGSLGTKWYLSVGPMAMHKDYY